MPFVLRLATPATRTLVVEALKAAGDQRTRVALKASRQVADAKAAGRDVRSQAVKVTALLAEAAELTALAEELADLEDLPVVTLPRLVSTEAAPIALRTPEEQAAEDDGTSPAAQALAAAAGLTDAAIVEDGVDTLAIAEDEPGDDDVVEVLR